MFVSLLNKKFTPSFKMKFSAEIENKYQYELAHTKENNKLELELVNRKQFADSFLSGIYPERKDIKYGSIIRKNNKDYFCHTVNSDSKKIDILPDNTSNIYQFLGDFFWHPEFSCSITNAIKNNLKSANK